MRRSVVPISRAESRLALTPSRRSDLLRAAKAFWWISSSDSDCTVLMEPMTSAAVAPISPLRCRSTRAILRIRPPSRFVERRKSGRIASPISESRQFIRNITTSIATSVRTWATSGMAAVIATSLSWPMSAMIRVTRSPVRFLL